MRRLAFLLAWGLAVALPVQALAGAFTIQLPFYYWNMAKCEAQPGQAVKAACEWGRNDRSGFDVRCAIDSQQQTARKALDLQISIWRTGANTVERKFVPGRKFNYAHSSGIACMAYVPSTMFDLTCQFQRGGFGCNWCTKSSCYQGQAQIRQVRR